MKTVYVGAEAHDTDGREGGEAHHAVHLGKRSQGLNCLSERRPENIHLSAKTKQAVEEKKSVSLVSHNTANQDQQMSKFLGSRPADISSRALQSGSQQESGSDIAYQVKSKAPRSNSVLQGPSAVTPGKQNIFKDKAEDEDLEYGNMDVGSDEDLDGDHICLRSHIQRFRNSQSFNSQWKMPPQPSGVAQNISFVTLHPGSNLHEYIVIII